MARRKLGSLAGVSRLPVFRYKLEIGISKDGKIDFINNIYVKEGNEDSRFLSGN